MNPDRKNAYHAAREGPNGKVEKSQVNIEERGWAELASPVVSAVGAYFGVIIPPEDVEKIGDALENVAYGSWEEAVHGLATDIAMQAYKRMYGITAYTEPNFKGKYQTFTPSVYNNHDFSSLYRRNFPLKNPPGFSHFIIFSHKE